MFQEHDLKARKNAVFRPDVFRVDLWLDEYPGAVLLLPLFHARPRQRDTRGHEQLVFLPSLGRRDGALEQHLQVTRGEILSVTCGF